MDAHTAARAIANQFPELAGAKVTYLGEGYDSVAFDVAPDWVFRFPKRADVETQLLLELRLLPMLAPRLGLAVPEYRFRGAPSALFPRHFAGYAKIAGSPAMGTAPEACDGELMERLGAFLTELHAFPTADARSAGVPTLDGEKLMDELHAEALADVSTLQSAIANAPVERWAASLDPPAPGDAAAAVLIHADFAAEHVLMTNDCEATGVIDWSEACIGDRALDLAGLFHWGGPDFAARVLRHYSPRADPGTLERARYFALCRGVADIVFGLEEGRETYVDAGVRAMESNMPAKE